MADASMAEVKVPSSTRSAAAIARVKPVLEEELAKKDLKYGSPIFIRIFKESKELEVFMKKDGQYHHFKTYPICTLGSGDLGPKLKQGDNQAPEGFYSVTARQMNPVSNYHLAFNIGYPNQYDRAHKRTGSALMVHGNCVSIGCFAMTDEGIEEIYTLADAALRRGQKSFDVHIFPFRMTERNMRKHRDSKWLDFWENLKKGYDIFEGGRLPPNVKVRDKRYVFP
ncbi:MAG: murein L,D-transpeptidase [Nanoarchaeota archaeon]|nr:murein L,D-transpeptidase [Nanoarchaeota archaeon]